MTAKGTSSMCLASSDILLGPTVLGLLRHGIGTGSHFTTLPGLYVQIRTRRIYRISLCGQGADDVQRLHEFGARLEGALAV